MRRVNCYTMIVKDGRAFHRLGFRCDSLEPPFVTVNGLDRHRLSKPPKEFDARDMSAEALAEIFAESPDPWLNREEDGVYLYGVHVDEEKYYMSRPEDEDHYEYVLLRTSSAYHTRVLGNGTVLFRLFDGDDQTVLFAIYGGSVIKVDDERYTMVEWVGRGEFVRR